MGVRKILQIFFSWIRTACLGLGPLYNGGIRFWDVLIVAWTLYLHGGRQECTAYGLASLTHSHGVEPLEFDGVGLPRRAESSLEAKAAAGWRDTLLGLEVEGYEDGVQSSHSSSEGSDSQNEDGMPSEHAGTSLEGYAGVLDTLERIARHESSDVKWLNVHLRPERRIEGEDVYLNSAATPTPLRVELYPQLRGSVEAGSEPLKGGFLSGSMLQLGSSLKAKKNSPNGEEPTVQSSESWGQKQARGIKKAQMISSSDEAVVVERSFDQTTTEFRVLADEESRNTEPHVNIQYTFPLGTSESRDIAFVVLALPQGYKVTGKAANSNFCSSLDPVMPPLKCSIRIRSAFKRKNTFVVVSSADPSRNLPLGKHFFKIAADRQTVGAEKGNPQSWWFATFRFTGGHAITKHFEDKTLLARRRCIWSEWRNETPCSTTCGGGFEIWTRNLFTGPSEEECGGAILKRRCLTEACSLSCQLAEWETISECTRHCGAKDGEAFKIRVRKVLMDSKGFGQSCSKLYPWHSTTMDGWAERLKAVVSLAPCDDKYKGECSAEVGCRVEELNTRSMPASFPWGVCPFPCGGFGSITSIVQVANGIPRWIGERDYPDTFQIPCRADKEPLITTRKCNTQACDDCSVYLENPEFGKATRAWIFFLPTLESDRMEITAPKGMTIISDTLTPDQTLRIRSGKVSRLSRILPSPAVVLNKGKPSYSETEGDDHTEALGSCSHMPNSFGGIKRCKVGESQHYRGSQVAEIRAKSIIEPSATKKEVPATPQVERVGKRPHWVALPVILGRKKEMENGDSFYLWLTTTTMPRDPEVFRCRLRANISLPRSCTVLYIPVNPEDCKKCSNGSDWPVPAYRRFVPAKHGGSCDLPSNMQEPNDVLTSAPCEVSCSHMPHDVSSKPGSKEAKAKEEQLSTVKRIAGAKLRRMLQKHRSSAGKGDRLDITTLIDGTTPDTAALYGGEGHGDSAGEAGQKGIVPHAN